MIHLSLFLKIKSRHRVSWLKAGRVCTQANSAQADVTNRRYCALSAALRTRLSDLNTASLASPGRVAASGAVEEPGLWTRRHPGLDVCAQALRRDTRPNSRSESRRALGDFHHRRVRSWEPFPGYFSELPTTRRLMENMLGDKASKSRSSSFYIENLLGSPFRDTRSPEVCAGRLERSCKSPRRRF